MNARRSQWWWTVGLVAALAGCSGMPALSEEGQLLEASGGPGLVKSPRSPVPDVPIPVGFTIVAKNSRSYAVAGGRYIEHRYQGQSSLADLVRFYREQLPASGWTRVAEKTEQKGVFVTQHRKGPETLDLRLTRVGRIVDVGLRITDPAIGDPGASSGL